MFAGPSITWATHRYVQKVFGVTPVQSLASGKPVFDVRGGTNAAGIGFSATQLLSKHWLLNLDTSTSWLQGSAADSPITEAIVRHSLAQTNDKHL